MTMAFGLIYVPLMMAALAYLVRSERYRPWLLPPYGAHAPTS